jgi:hypothetical protein
MPALVAGIRVLINDVKDVDGRDKPGHDGLCLETRRTEAVQCATR